MARVGALKMRFPLFHKRGEGSKFNFTFAPGRLGRAQLQFLNWLKPVT